MADPIRLLVADGDTWDFASRVRKSPAGQGFEVIIPRDGSEQVLLQHAGEADAILCYEVKLPGSVIRAAGSLKFIQKHGTNCRHVDVAAATERNIPVATLRSQRSMTVAEHAMALLLACARKVVQGHAAVTQSVYRTMGLEPIQTTQRNYRPNWAKIAGMTELNGATVGIIGMGDIGMEIARRCRAFEMSLCYSELGPHPAGVEKMLGIRYLPIDDLLSASDFVVLSLPHIPQTEGLIGEKQLARMKPTAILINVSRGALIDEDALVAALRDQRIAMAGLDVYRREPLPAESPLQALSNVVLLPHLGGGSNRFREMDIPSSLQNIHRFFHGERPDGLVNPDSAGVHIWR